MIDDGIFPSNSLPLSLRYTRLFPFENGEKIVPRRLFTEAVIRQIKDSKEFKLANRRRNFTCQFTVRCKNKVRERLNNQRLLLTLDEGKEPVRS
ncbi:hypothetical protein NC651_027821 [Populus alba x Populus x berolinensis]|nr:hypothetical protein NC651_027821 [Populus alba x Populus x berolinensis]